MSAVQPRAPAAPPAGPPLCPSCRAPVPGRFCGECGQRYATRLVSVRRMVAEVLGDQLALNSALPRTLSSLLLHPGHLTRESVAGRIVRYIPPFRLYLLCSVLCFLVTALRDPGRWLAHEAARKANAPPAGAPVPVAAPAGSGSATPSPPRRSSGPSPAASRPRSSG